VSEVAAPVSEEVAKPKRASRRKVEPVAAEPVIEEVAKPKRASRRKVEAVAAEPVVEEVVKPKRASRRKVDATPTNGVLASTEEVPAKVRRTRAKRSVAEAVNGTSGEPPVEVPPAPTPAQKRTRARRTAERS
jgi:hypothetical protein